LIYNFYGAVLLRSKEVCQILELVRSYSVPIRDDRVSKLITWYVKKPREEGLNKPNETRTPAHILI
jgi:hypothetical protein